MAPAPMKSVILEKAWCAMCTSPPLTASGVSMVTPMMM